MRPTRTTIWALPRPSTSTSREVQEADKLNGVITGTLDITDPSMDVDTADAIEQANDTGELTGNVVTTDLVDNLGYGYIGMNTHNVSVGGDPGSDASRTCARPSAPSSPSIVTCP